MLSQGKFNSGRKTEEIKTKVFCPVEVRYGVAEHLRGLRNAIEEEYEKTDRAKVDKSWLETVIDRHYNPEKYLDEFKVDPQDFSALFDEYTLRHKVSDVRAKNNQVLKRAVMRFELFRRLTVKGQKAYTFNVREVTPTILPFISEQKYNDAIKEVFRLAGINRVVTVLDPTTRREVRMPISECASSHMARRTFCGNLYKRVKDPNIVASMSGHKEGSKAFARYREIDKDIKRDALKVFEAI